MGFSCSEVLTQISFSNFVLSRSTLIFKKKENEDTIYLSYPRYPCPWGTDRRTSLFTKVWGKIFITCHTQSRYRQKQVTVLRQFSSHGNGTELVKLHRTLTESLKSKHAKQILNLSTVLPHLWIQWVKNALSEYVGLMLFPFRWTPGSLPLVCEFTRFRFSVFTLSSA